MDSDEGDGRWKASLDHEEWSRFGLIARKGLPFQAEEIARGLVKRQHGAANVRHRVAPLVGWERAGYTEKK